MSIPRYRQLATNNEGFCFDPRTGETYQLNESAQFILNALKEGRSQHEAAQALAETFLIPPSDALSDTEEFMQMLRIYGVLES